MKSSPVYQAAPVGLCYLDRELRYVEINEWFARINGVAVEEHLGLTVYDVIPDAAETLASQLEVVAESREPMLAGRVATRTRAHPNEKRTYEHNFFPDIRRGAVVGFNIVVWDVTDRVDGRGQETGSTVHNALEAPAAPPPDTKAAGARPNTPTIELPFDAVLTAREREVVVALARTGVLADVAGALFVSEHTVRNHLRSVYKKLGVRSQTELLSVMLRGSEHQ